MTLRSVADGIAGVIDEVRKHRMCTPEECASLLVSGAASVVIANREPAQSLAATRERFIARCADIFDQAEAQQRDAARVVVPTIEGLDS